MIQKMSTQQKEIELFQDQPFLRWSGVAGKWKVENEVEISDIDKEVIYKSPEEPSYVAWVGLWKETVLLRFVLRR